jgi:signal transduction histidine kinase
VVATILVVEDDESVGLALSGVLEAEGYLVEQATRLPEALAKIERMPFDVLVLDMRLVEADGLSIMERVSERSPGPIGIILTGPGSLDNALQAVRSGSDDFLVKPVDGPALRASVFRVLERRARAAERTRRVTNEQTLRAAEAAAGLTAAEAVIQQLHELFMQVPAMIAVVRGAEHVVELVNRQYVQAMGRRDPSELLGKPLREATPELGRQAFFERLDYVYDTGQPYVGHELPAMLEHGGGERPQQAYLDVVLQPLRNGRGEVDGIFAYAAEVTDYVRARERMEELDRLKEEFISTASHDLKGPLTSIRGHAQLVLRRVRDPDPDHERIAHGLAVIDAQAVALTRLLDDLLDASRIQSGALELRMAPCDLGLCLETILARLNPGERARVDVTLPDAPLAGEWEQTRIEQVLANLVGNALKYSPESERVTVTVERRALAIELIIGDQGIGIPPEELPRLFERFHRTPQALASGLPGTGLGLYISRGIVTGHRGRIWADSAGAGRGAAFHVTLPAPPLDPAEPGHHAERRTHGQRDG